MKYNKIVKEMEAIMGLCKYNGEEILNAFDNYTDHKYVNKKFNKIGEKDFRDYIGTEEWNGKKAFVLFYFNDFDKDTLTEMFNTLDEENKNKFIVLVFKHIIAYDIQKIYLTGSKTFKKNIETFCMVEEFLKDFEDAILEGNRQYENN